MSVEEILAAMQAIMDQAAKAADGQPALTDEEANRFEELEAELATARKREDRSTGIVQRFEQWTAPAPALIRSRPADVTEEQEEFRHAFMSGKLSSVEDWKNVEHRAQSSSTTAGGYTIPASFREKLVRRQVAFGGIANNAEQMTTDDWSDYPFPTVDDTSHTAEVVAENSAPASAGADITFGTKTLKAFRIVASGASNTWLKVPVQLMDSSYLNWEDFVTSIMGERLGRKEAAYAAQGAGSTEPEGLLTGLSSAGSIADNSVGALYADLVAAETAVDAAYRDMGNCKWYMHDAIWAKIRGLVDDASRPIVLEQAVAGIGTGVQRQLLGYPVVIDNSLPSTWGDNAKTLAFGDIREAFVVRRVKNPIVVSDPLQFFLNGQVGFLAASGFGSLVQNPNAATVLTGFDVP